MVGGAVMRGPVVVLVLVVVCALAGVGLGFGLGWLNGRWPL